MRAIYDLGWSKRASPIATFVSTASGNIAVIVARRGKNMALLLVVIFANISDAR
jgi:hypothetical protein